MEKPRRTVSFARRRVWKRKPFLKPLHDHAHGVQMKRLFLRHDKEYLFDPVFDEKPTLRSWIGRAKRQLMGELGEEESQDFLCRFMNLIRQKLYVSPSAEQQRIMRLVLMEADLSGD